MRLEGKVAIVVGAGQTAGETIGNGRATAILFAREGARVFLVDRDLESSRETGAMIEGEGGTAAAFEADDFIKRFGALAGALDTRSAKRSQIGGQLEVFPASFLWARRRSCTHGVEQ